MREGTALGYALTPPSEAEVAAAVSGAACALQLPAWAGRGESWPSLRRPALVLPPTPPCTALHWSQARQGAELEAQRT